MAVRANKTRARPAGKPLRPRRAARTVAKNTSAKPDRWFVDWVRGGDEGIAGIPVTPDTAMRCGSVFACVRVRSEDLAKLPLMLYRRRPDGGKERATEHPLYGLMHDRPNRRQTSYEWRQVMQARIDLRGNAHALKEFDDRGRVIALWPLDPAKVQTLQAPDGDLFYRIGAADPVPEEAVLHLRGLSLDGITGLSPIAYHRETIGLAMGAQRYGAAFFGNNAQPPGAIKVPTVLDDDATRLLRDSWERRHRGIDNAHRVAILDGGMDWVSTGIDNTDAQYLETRKFQRAEIAALYRVPPHKIADLDKATFSNIEHQSLEYVIDCLMPAAVAIEQRLSLSLLSEEDRRAGLFFEIMMDGLLRGDFKTRMEGYAIGRNWGILSVNDCRDKENMNRIANGDIYLQPLNMVEAGTTPEQIKERTRALIAYARVLAAQEELNHA